MLFGSHILFSFFLFSKKKDDKNVFGVCPLPPMPHGKWNARLPLFLKTDDPLFRFSGWRGEWWAVYLNLRAPNLYQPPEWIAAQVIRTHTERNGWNSSRRRRELVCEVAWVLFIDHFSSIKAVSKVQQRWNESKKAPKKNVKNNLRSWQK